MNAAAREFTVRPSGGGSTFSALRLVTGIQKVAGVDIYLIDTENGRARDR
jgi:hypothetical protein